jgi:flavin-dependent dehydrogenase
MLSVVMPAARRLRDHRRVERVGRALHDGHHRGDGRVPRGAPAVRAGQAFTLLLIVSGVGTAFYTATLLATVIVEGGLHRRFERRRIERMLEELRDHFILCGYGRIGSMIAEELDQQKVPFVIIERSPSACSRCCCAAGSRWRPTPAATRCSSASASIAPAA